MPPPPPKKKKKKKKLTKGHNFVKIMTPENLKLHAHLQTMPKHSASYQVSPIMNIEGMVGTEPKSAWAVTPTEIVKKNSKATCTSSYHRKEVYKISNESDERCRMS